MRQTLLSSCFAQMRQLRQLGESQVRELEGFEPRQCGTEPKPLYGTVFSLYLLNHVHDINILTVRMNPWIQNGWGVLVFMIPSILQILNLLCKFHFYKRWSRVLVKNKSQQQTNPNQTTTKEPTKKLKKPPKPWLGSIPGSGTSSCVI